MLFRHGLKAMCIASGDCGILPRLAKSSARLQRTKLAEFHAGVKTGLPEDADEPPVLFSERKLNCWREGFVRFPTA